MSNSLNEVRMTGRLGRNPEVKYLASGQAVCNFSLAISESYKPKDSKEWKEVTFWQNCVAWGKVGEALAATAQKGDEVLVIGKLKENKYTDREGVEKVDKVVQCAGARVLMPVKKAQTEMEGMESTASAPPETQTTRETPQQRDPGVAVAQVPAESELPF